jgi:hypothetical protein
VIFVRRLAFAAAALSLASAALGAQAAPPAPTTPATPATPATPVAAPAAPTPAISHAEAIAFGRATVRAAFTGAVDSLVATAAPESATGDLRGRLTDGVTQISMQLGAERRMISERVMKVEGRIEYWRTAEFELVPVPIVFRVTLGSATTWRGFTANVEEMMPAAEEVKP